MKPKFSIYFRYGTAWFFPENITGFEYFQGVYEKGRLLPAVINSGLIVFRPL